MARTASSEIVWKPEMALSAQLRRELSKSFRYMYALTLFASAHIGAAYMIVDLRTDWRPIILLRAQQTIAAFLLVSVGSL